MNLNEQIDKVEQNLLPQKQEQTQTDAPKQEVAIPKTNDTDIMSVIKSEEEKLLQTDDVKKLGRRFSEERVKADLASEASRIREKNLDTAERQFANETRELRLKHLKAELEQEHKYNMETLERDAKQKAMLDNRKKLVEKYGYLYDNDKTTIAYDKDYKEYQVPEDFSFSPFVNKMRQIGRNISKLDRPVLQMLKWFLIVGGGIAIYFILKSLNVIG